MAVSDTREDNSASVIDGRKTADELVEKVKAEAASLKSKTGVVPGIAVVIVGEDPASQVYVRSKGNKAEECGFKSVTHRLAEDVAQDKLLDLISELNSDPSIHGILVQLPLPDHIAEGEVIQAISPDKDVDGFHFINVGRLATGEMEQAFVPCTPAGSMVLLRKALGKSDFSGLNAVVVGRSNIVGKPVASLLLASNATVTIAHSRTNDLPGLCRTADILVAAVGRPEMIKGDWIKPGACIVDVGINRIDAPERGEGKKRLVGDVAYDECAKVAESITPVPGGVGPMTIAMLMANTLTGACRASGVEPPQF
ncbi:MAG: bifunctional methylenetetrahydrofolate dehydrogenase/methenyltetrahydrofolate cyclohydrolase FolD [Rhizobiaceae bacterium]